MAMGVTRPVAEATWLAADDAEELRAAVAVLRRRAQDTLVLRFIVKALLGAANRLESQF